MNLETVRKLNNLLGELREGTISDEDFIILDSWIATDREVCEFYVDYIMVWAELYGFQAASCPELALDNMGVIELSNTKLLEVLAEREKVAEAIKKEIDTPIVDIPLSTKTNKNADIYILHKLKFIVAACLLIVFSVLISNTFSNSNIATITETIGVESDSKPVLVGTRFSPDEVLTIRNGIVKLFIDNGVDLVIEGPASVTFKSKKELYLQTGNLFARVSKSAIGFTVDTPYSQIVDMGTEFGVGINDASSIWTEVYKGLVQLSANTSGTNNNKIMLKAGQKGAVSSTGNISCSEFSIDERKYIMDISEFGDGTLLLKHNLIVNGDFEHDTVSYEKGQADSGKLSLNNIAIYGWQDTVPATLNTYSTWGTGGENTFTQMDICAVPTDKGNNFYVAHSTGTIYQDVPVSKLAWKINRGIISYNFSAWLGGWAEQDDSLIVQLDFLNKTGNILQTATVTSATPQERNNIPGFVKKATSGIVPVGTDKIKVSLTVSEYHGSTADAYADNLSLILE